MIQSQNYQIVKDQKVKLTGWDWPSLSRLADSLNMPLVYHKYRHLSRGILIKICTNRGNFLRSSFPYLATRLAASPWRMLNYQIFKDQCQDFWERAASRQAAVLSASLPHYTLYRLFVKPSCTLIRNYLEVFISCRNLLVSKDLRHRGAAPPALSAYQQTSYDS